MIGYLTSEPYAGNWRQIIEVITYNNLQQFMKICAYNFEIFVCILLMCSEWIARQHRFVRSILPVHPLQQPPIGRLLQSGQGRHLRHGGAGRHLCVPTHSQGQEDPIGDQQPEVFIPQKGTRQVPIPPSMRMVTIFII